MAEDENNKKDTKDVEESPPDTVGYDDKTLLQEDASVAREGADPEKTQVPYLIVVDGPRQGVRFPLNAGDNTIGRAMGSEILLEDQSVSRRHSVVTVGHEGLTVEDNGSKNGTFVNGQKISEKVTIGHGDVVQVGIYLLRLITKEVAKEEELGPLPPDWEGKTVMMAASPDEETATVAKPPTEDMEERPGEAEEAPQKPDFEKTVPAIPQEEKKKRPGWWNILLIVIIVLAIGGGGAFALWKFFPFWKKSTPTKPVKPSTIEGEQKPVVPPKPGLTTPKPTPPAPVVPKAVPIFLDFASSPFPAKVTFEGKDYGITPLKVQLKLEVEKTYAAEALFDFREIGEQYRDEVTFTVDADQTVIPVLFKGPIGVLKVMQLPRDVEMYLEGYFIYNPFNAKPAKLQDIVLGKPIYIPYGKYIIELRKPKEIAGSGEYVKDIRYRREILVAEDSPVYVLEVTDLDLEKFPAEILSVPTGADVFVDVNLVGKTPYKGIFPLGEHTLSLRKEGYFEHKQELKVDINSPFRIEITLKTTVAGEHVNAAKLLMNKARYREAIAKLTEVFEKSPTPGEVAQARYLIGSSFIHLGDLTSAEAYLNQAKENENFKYPAMLGLVSVYHGLGRRAEAIPLLVEVMMNAKDKVVKEEASIQFQQISPLRSIMYIYTEPEGAKVYMNDKLVDEITPLILPDLTLGNYRLKIEKDGYISQDLSINLSVNEFNPVIMKLKKVPE